MKRATPSFALALAIGALGSCTEHAPRRMDPADGSARPFSATMETPRRQAAAYSAEIYPEFTLVFIEFDDQGRLWSRAQLDLLDQTLASEAARESYEGLNITLFAHGWKHDASVCDTNVACFRTFLAQIASDLALATGDSPGREKPPRVVGIYAGWRGLSVSVPVLYELSFWARKRAAERIGAGELVEVLTHLDQFVERENAGGRFRSGLNVIGHSLGGTMIYGALANVLKARVVEALGRQTTIQPVDNVVTGFGDVVLLVNPAFEASLYAPIVDALAQFRSFSPYQSPVLTIVQSETDMPNRMWFEIGRDLDVVFERTGPRSGRTMLTTAVGNYEPFVTHRLEAPGTRAKASTRTTPIGEVSDCVCRLPLMEIPQKELLLVQSFLSRERRGELAEEESAPPPISCPSGLDLGRARLTCRPNLDPLRPFWVVRATDEVVRGHNGLFTSPMMTFVRYAILDARTKKAARLSRRDGRAREPSKPHGAD